MANRLAEAKRRQNRHLVTDTLAGRYPLRPAAGRGRAAASKYAVEFDKNGKTAGNSGLTGIEVPLDQKHFRRRTPIQTGDGIPLAKPIEPVADSIVSGGGTPIYFAEEYRKPRTTR